MWTGSDAAKGGSSDSSSQWSSVDRGSLCGRITDSGSYDGVAHAEGNALECSPLCSLVSQKNLT